MRRVEFIVDVDIDEEALNGPHNLPEWIRSVREAIENAEFPEHYSVREVTWRSLRYVSTKERDNE